MSEPDTSTMRVLRVLNNNVVISRDPQDQEVILTGRGIGFRAQPGQKVDPLRRWCGCSCPPTAATPTTSPRPSR